MSAVDELKATAELELKGSGLLVAAGWWLAEARAAFARGDVTAGNVLATSLRAFGATFGFSSVIDVHVAELETARDRATRELAKPREVITITEAEILGEALRTR